MTEARRILIDHTHPEGDMYEWHFAIREIPADREITESCDGPAGILQVGFDDREEFFTPEWDRTTEWDKRWDDDAIFVLTLNYDKALKIYNDLPYDEQASIKEWVYGEDGMKKLFAEMGEFNVYDCLQFAVIRYVLNLWNCEGVWWLHY